MSDGSIYDADYFLHGKQTGKSLYENYRWLPNLTIPMCCAIIRHLGIEPNDTILDFGCARGYVVRAFREMGYDAWGYDISKWAIDNADPEAREYLSGSHNFIDTPKCFTWVIAKDVLEHVTELCVINVLQQVARKGVFAVVPLAHMATAGREYDPFKYDVPEYEKDVTHIHRQPLDWWVGRFCEPGWSVEGRYRVRGIKDNYAQFPTGNGFIVARRLGE